MGRKRDSARTIPPMVHPGRIEDRHPPESFGSAAETPNLEVPPALVALRDMPIGVQEAFDHVSVPELGGTAIFVGSVRPDPSPRGKVDCLDYEAYEGVAESVMGKIAAEAQTIFGAGRTVILHRVGRLLPGEIAVITAAACPHRDAAFAACRHLIDEVKNRAPIWKREWAGGAGEWVLCSHDLSGEETVAP